MYSNDQPTDVYPIILGATQAPTRRVNINSNDPARLCPEFGPALQVPQYTPHPLPYTCL